MKGFHIGIITKIKRIKLKKKKKKKVKRQAKEQKTFATKGLYLIHTSIYVFFFI